MPPSRGRAGSTIIAIYSPSWRFTEAKGNVAGQQGHYPFGESWYQGTTTTEFQFTDYLRDPESGNDYAMLRYHVNRLGRFSSPDRLAGSIGNPQSLNRYAYVRNEPVDFIDPLGLECSWNADMTALVCDATFVLPPDDRFFIEFQLCAFAGICRGGGGGGGGGDGDPTRGGGGGSDAGEGIFKKVKNAVKSVVCAVTQPLQDLAFSNQGVIGVGIGGSAGIGVIGGVSVTGGVQIVATPEGEVGVALTFGGNPGFGVLGVGAQGGVQATNSTARNLAQFGGQSVGVSGAFQAVGVAVSGDRNTVNTTITVGPGVGARFSGVPSTGLETTGTFVLGTSCR